jgi:hypothetical protein
MSNIQAKEGNSTLAIGSARTRHLAERLIAQLKQADFPEQDLSVMLADDRLKDDPKIALDHKPGDDPADEKPRDGSEKLKGLTVGAVSGGVILGTIGGLIGLASLAIPGLGLILVAGPITAVLTDAAAAGAAGAIAGALMGMRIPEHRAQQYERRVREGNILISVHTQNTEALKRAMNILEKGGAEDLHEVVETSGDLPSRSVE